MSLTALDFGFILKVKFRLVSDHLSEEQFLVLFHL